MKHAKQALALVMSASLTVGILAGCGTSGTTSGTTATPGNTTGANVEGTTAGETGTSDFAYPMTGDRSLTYWADLNTSAAANYTNLGDTPFGKGLMENTGVNITFLHPPTGQREEQFSLMLADGDLTDLMEYHWMTFPGGPEKAIADGTIISLNEVIDKYCPNLKKYLAEHPEVDRQAKTDDGNYYMFPFVRGDEELRVTNGLWIRQDWLDELNLPLPTTIDEWHTALTAFKEQKGANAPFTYEYNNDALNQNFPFQFSFNTTKMFYVGDDGKVHFGAAEENFKEYLTVMNQWYSEGLLDPDLATQQVDQVSAKMTNGTSGASTGWAGSRAGVWTKAALATDPNYNLQPAPVPTSENVPVVTMGQIENVIPNDGGVAITTSCKDIETAARMLDWAYSEEGHMYYNFGTEGVSYTMQDGNPVYTDEIMNNPNGWPVAQAMSAYIRGNYNGPFVQDLRYLKQYYTYDGQKKSNATWFVEDSGKHNLPPITATAEESDEFSTIMNEINTYRDEMMLKFILGTENLDNFDTYVQNMKTMGLDRALEIENAALTRYNNR